MEGPPEEVLLDAALARPGDHLARLLPVFDAEADLAEEANAGGRELREIMLLHTWLNDRRAGGAPSRRWRESWKSSAAR